MPILNDEIRFRVAGWLGAALVRALHVTWRVREVGCTEVSRGARDGSRPVIAAFWHRHLLAMMGHYAGYRICVPVSEHRDGEYVAHAMARFGIASVRGSSTRGGIRVLKGLIQKAEEGWSLAITPDGPRGPIYSVHPGVFLLARRTGLPVHPVGVAVRGPIVLSSWDRFVVPKPGARLVVAVGEPLTAADFDEAASFCDALKGALFAATGQAEGALPPVR